MTASTILVTGASGFIGEAVCRRMTELGHGARLRLLVHRRAPGHAGAGGMDCVHGDLTRPAGLRGLCDGIETVIHAASDVGADADACDAVNRSGTRALVEEARRAGVRRMIYVGTAAVYGAGVHRGIRENEVAPVPVSAASRSRLAAEQCVLAAGGVVLRPMFIMGAGDQWFLPTLLRLIGGLNAWIEEGRAVLSCTTVETVASAVAAIALEPGTVARGAVYHCTHPEPVRVRDLVEAAAAHVDFTLPRTSVGLTEALRRLPSGVSERQARLFAEDHWYDGARLWQALGTSPGMNVLAHCDAYWQGYRRWLADG
ncbi:NAD-dependent epimerase/dehydratase family protein [Burkholderia paludis]|uniref:NAD-dependent epimerase/dehydratase family protein n=1 Tax=Burkholderia paludis TaxID=1506587 RepID=UPI00068BF1D1|nr:NAD-dependent epimerase/dehydratase family protein [Burkholderia paludis]